MPKKNLSLGLKLGSKHFLINKYNIFYINVKLKKKKVSHFNFRDRYTAE